MTNTTHSKLPYATNNALISAFKAGAAFDVIDYGARRKVTSITELPSGRIEVRTVLSTGTGYTGFNPDGTNKNGAFYQLVAAGPHPTTAEPFLKRYVNGEPAHCPKTREVVEAVSFVKGAIRVTLRNEKGDQRVSEHYKHDGTHMYRPERSLVFGELPKLKVKKTIRVFKDPRNWSHDAYFALSPIQVLPNLRAFEGLKPVAVVEIEE